MHLRRTLTTGVVAPAVVLALLAVPGIAEARVVAPGDTLSSIAQDERVSMRDLMAANGITDADRVVEGTTLVIPGGAGSSDVREVRPGDTLTGIARALGVSVRSLVEVNGLTNPDRIRSGSTLRIGPTGTRTSGTASDPAPAATSGRTAEKAEVRALITQAAQDSGWRPAVPLGLAMNESGWNNRVVSSAGAIGIMQVLPATGEWVATYLLKRPLDLNDPADNVAAGMAYLDYLHDRFDGDVEMVLAAYFEGPRRTEDAGGPSTAGAQRYVDTVLALADRYR
jgi:N-acetylmuramoyl-L-alanine amidase